MQTHSGASFPTIIIRTCSGYGHYYPIGHEVNDSLALHVRFVKAFHLFITSCFCCCCFFKNDTMYYDTKHENNTSREHLRSNFMED